MNIEQETSKINEFYFFREFTYSKNKFIMNTGQEVEVADNIIYLDDIFIVYQVKTRESIETPSSEKDNIWFDKKVLRKATKQIRDTIKYIRDYDEIILCNQRGDSFNIATGNIKSAQKIVIYTGAKLLSENNSKIKFHKSKTVGIIHILSWESYEKIITTLITPSEVFEYLDFREKIIDKHHDKVNLVSEESLLGQYIVADFEGAPDEKNSKIVQNLKENYNDWDLLNIIHLFPKRVTYSTLKTDYYHILREIAKLMRHELKVFKERFIISMQSSKENKPDLPYRFSIPASNLGFVFIPLCKDQIENRKNALTNFTLGHKYEQKLKKCIGTSFLYEDDGWFSVEWCYIEFEWKYDPKMENMLKKSFPFREVKHHIAYRYQHML